MSKKWSSSFARIVKKTSFKEVHNENYINEIHEAKKSSKHALDVTLTAQKFRDDKHVHSNKCETTHYKRLTTQTVTKHVL